MYIDLVKFSKAVFEQYDHILSHLADSNTADVENDDSVVCDSVIISEETIQE